MEETELRRQLVDFSRRVRQPGVWGPVAIRAGGEPRADLLRLARGLAATALASVSIFSILTGLGAWLVSSPAPTWWP